ncbi:MAG: hypothetical protein ACHP8A_18750, partial [Terriglobales bacterium]
RAITKAQSSNKKGAAAWPRLRFIYISFSITRIANSAGQMRHVLETYFMNGMKAIGGIGVFLPLDKNLGKVSFLD